MSDSMQRLTFDLDHDRLSKLDQMVADGRFVDRKDLLNNALTVMGWVISHAKLGHEVAALDDPPDQCFVLSMPFLTGLSEK